MARAVKGFNYGNILALASRRAGDVERMSPYVRRVYLRRHLKLIEAQIQFLSHKLGIDSDELVHDWTWAESPMDDDKWASLVNLDYLVAAREALLQTLDSL